MSGSTEYDPPKYMGPGSEGPVVELLLEFLRGKIKEEGGDPSCIPLNRRYEGKAVEMVKELQLLNGFDDDGGFGPDIRMAIETEFDFNTKTKALGTDTGINAFVQQDESILYWGNGIKPTKLLDVATAEFEKVHGIRAEAS